MRVTRCIAFVSLTLLWAPAAHAEEDCASEEFTNACEVHEELFQEASKASRASPTSSRSSDLFIAGLTAWPETKQKLEAFKSRWGQCLDKGAGTCTFKKSNWKKFAKMEQKYETGLPEALGSIRKACKRSLDTIQGLIDKKDYVRARAASQHALAQYKPLADATSDAELTTMVGTLKAMDADLAKKELEQLQSVRCPAGKNRNKGLEKTLNKVMGTWLGAKSEKYRQKLLVLRLDSKTKKETDIQGTKWEYVNTVVCAELTAAVHKEDPTRCRIDRFSFKRSKPKGSGWSDWGVNGVIAGSDQKIICKNVK